VVYDSLSDLVDKIKYYLSHDQERELTAKAGQDACIKRHGFDTRIIEMENIFYKYAD
jgi:spore maturation protein CgeB